MSHVSLFTKRWPFLAILLIRSAKAIRAAPIEKILGYVTREVVKNARNESLEFGPIWIIAGAARRDPTHAGTPCWLLKTGLQTKLAQTRAKRIWKSRSSTLKKRITIRTDFHLCIPPKEMRLVPYQREFSSAEYKNLRRGVIPGSMDDKWFIFAEGPWVEFHRSWTGFCVFRIRLERSRDKWQVAEFWVNSDRNQYNPENEQSVLNEIDRVLDSLCREKTTRELTSKIY